MPLIKLQIATEVPEDKKTEIMTAASRIVADATGKPETYVMAMVEDDAIASLGGNVCPAAFADVRGIGGLDGGTNAAISKGICGLLQEKLGIEPDKVYLVFTDVAASNWGCNGSTFG